MVDKDKSSAAPPSSPGRTGRTIQSLDRAMALLDALAASPAGVPLGELARRTGLAVPTAQGLLRTLEAWDMIAQPARAAPYALGPRVLRLARQWLDSEGHATLARPFVEEFARDTGEYALLAELRAGRLYRLVEVETAGELRVRPAADDDRRRMHVMATAKVLLAALPPRERAATVARLAMPSLGPRTITDRDAFLRQLDRVSREGYALSSGETSPHVAALAVPVSMPGGAVQAALGTYVPAVRLSRARRAILLAALRRSAASISQAWGGAATATSQPPRHL